jgi:uncharacterized membrane protein YhhN
MFEVVFVLLCATYLLLIPWAPPLPAALFKILPILMLLARAAWRAPRDRRIYLALGLLFSLVGDATLALSPETFFVQGVAAFLVAHILYVVTFRPAMRFSSRSAILAALVLGWCTAAGVLLFPHLGTLRLPVVVYMIVIATMGACAAFATGARLTLFTGAFAFVISDSTLAADRFVTTFTLAPYLVMVTYYFGQFCIVEGVVGQTTSSGRPIRV